MIKKIIEQYRQKKKQEFLSLPDSHVSQFAFVGIGGHSISNLYPVIEYLGVPLQLIFSNTESNAALMAKRFQNAKGTSSLKDICADATVKGVFVCTKADHHFKIVKELLESKKHVFVEKPPCQNLNELNELISLQEKFNLHCCVGLQRRYAPVYQKLKARCSKAVHYSYSFATGSYPDGDVLNELFIHPLDVLVFLFGKVKQIKVQATGSRADICYDGIIEHENGVKGVVHLSTLHSWKRMEEQLQVTTPREVFCAEYPLLLTGMPKQSVVFGVPLEKVRPTVDSIQLYHNNNGLHPVKEQNILVDQGYFGEILSFVNMVNGKKTKNLSSLKDSKFVFEMIEEIKLQTGY